MKDRIEYLTDNELPCWIRYVWHQAEAQKSVPAVFGESAYDLWKGLLEDCLAEAWVRWG